MTRIWRKIRRGVPNFRRDERGSISMQVIIFSLLLLGTTSVVLDSGRLYSQHSEMQAYADQMALAAANELDGQDGAIQRAVNAVYGQSGQAPYLAKAGIEIGQFQIESIGFYPSMAPTSKTQNDMTEAFPSGTAVAYATLAQGAANPNIDYGPNTQAAAEAAALYVVVKARDASTKSTYSHISNSIIGWGNEIESRGLDRHGNFKNKADPRSDKTWIGFGAVAAASAERTTCAELSTLVFCNPWEDQTTDELMDVDPSSSSYTVRGRSLMYFAPNFSTPTSGTPVQDGQAEYGSLYNWDLNHQLFQLTDPLVDAGAVCSDQNVPRLFDGEDYIIARDRCLMAKAQTDEVCWSDDEGLSIVPAHGPTVSRAVNTAFDIWMEPFRTALEQPPIASIQTLTGLGYHQFFEPDQVATTLYENADWYGADPTQLQDDQYEYGSGAADGILIHGHTVPAYGLTTLASFATGLGYDVCHNNTYSAATGNPVAGNLCAVDFIGDHYSGRTYPNTAPRTPVDDMAEYWERMYDSVPIAGLPPAIAHPSRCGSGLEATFPGLVTYCENATIPTDGSIDTWYQVYQREKAKFIDVVTRGESSRVEQWGDGTTNAIDYQQWYNLTGPTDDYVKHGPDDYLNLTGETSLFAPNRERRRIRSAMVNCGAVTSAGTNADGHYEVSLDQMRIMDVYLAMPAGHYCGSNFSVCDVDSSIETQLFVEPVRDRTDEFISQRMTAQLVR